MASKPKTTETSAAVLAPAVEAKYSEGLELLNAGKLAEAAAAFTLVQTEAINQERLNLGRSARSYLAAIQARLQEQGASSAESAEFTAQLQLNQRNPQGALETLDKAIHAAPDRAAAHYLKAVAHAQLTQNQESADALGRAVALDADLLFQFRLEADFDGIRHTGPFAALLRG